VTGTSERPASAAPARRRLLGGLQTVDLFDKFGLLMVILLGVLVLTQLSDVFFTYRNFTNVLYQATIVAIVALGQMFVILTAGIDLSVGSVLALSSVLSVGLVVNEGLPVPVAILVAMVAGLVFGLLNGLMVAKFRISPLIVTLATLSIARGLAYIYSGGLNIAPVPAFFNSLRSSTFLGVPSVIPFTLLLAVLAHGVLTRTRFGRSIFATGGNEEAARMAGIRTDRVVITAYAISGTLAALGGVLIAARLGAGAATVGSGLELTVIAAVVIGGTSLFGGDGSVSGTMLGVLLLALVTNGINLLGVPANFDLVVSGVVIALAAGLDVYRRLYLAPKLARRSMRRQIGRATEGQPPDLVDEEAPEQAGQHA
jgi:ribose transport system permease protein